MGAWGSGELQGVCSSGGWSQVGGPRFGGSRGTGDLWLELVEAAGGGFEDCGLFVGGEVGGQGFGGFDYLGVGGG